MCHDVVSDAEAALGVDAASMMLQARGFQALTPANRIALHTTTETV